MSGSVEIVQLRRPMSMTLVRRELRTAWWAVLHGITGRQAILDNGHGIGVV